MGWGDAFKTRELIFWFQPGCPACAVGKPILEAFARQHPEVHVQYRNILQRDTALEHTGNAYQAQATPTYLYIENNQGVVDYALGPLELEQLEAFIQGYAPEPVSARRGRR